MKRFIVIIAVFFIIATLKSQNLDLIVLTNGDSLACRIDSVANTHIFIEMKSAGDWVKTLVKTDEVINYEYDAIKKNNYVYKGGSSYISRTKEFIPFRKNSVYGELGGGGILASVNYERLLPLNNNNAISVGGSIGFFADLILKTNYIYGDSRNFVEVGVGISLPVTIIIPQIGYRYQAPNGFLFKAAVLYFKPTSPDSFGDVPWVAMSFGYSF